VKVKPNEFKSQNQLIESILSLITSKHRLMILISAYIGKYQRNLIECLTLDDLLKITGLPKKELIKEIKILINAHLLKLSNGSYSITELGCQVLQNLGVTEELLKEYSKPLIISKIK
jgi:predicted transcriptional regulator